LMYDLTPEEYPGQDRHLWEPFLHKITNWCVCVSRHLGLPPKQASEEPIKERLKFDRPTDTQRLSVTGPPPTCPFILNRQCQRADAHPLPVRLVPGIGYTD
jgi:hypothetical protein